MTMPEYGAMRTGIAPEGSFRWAGNLATKRDIALHKHVSPDVSGQPAAEWEHRHAGGGEEHYHEPYRDLSCLGKDELERELGKREAAEFKACQEAAIAQARLERDLALARENEFIERIGITREQFDKVSDYIYEQQEANQ